MNSLEIVKVDKPFHIDKLPLDKVYVIDDYLEQTLHHFLDQKISNQPTWSKTNSVRGQSKTGLPHHQFWGTSFFRGDKSGNMVNDTPKEYTYIAKWLNCADAITEFRKTCNSKCCPTFLSLAGPERSRGAPELP